MLSTSICARLSLSRVCKPNTHSGLRMIARAISSNESQNQESSIKDSQGSTTRESQSLGTASLKSTLTPQTTSHVSALPPIPSKPPTRPTPWLNLFEMFQYLLPIRTSAPWKVVPTHVILQRVPLKSTIVGKVGEGGKLTNEDIPVGNGLQFVGNYFFRDIGNAKEFLDEVKRIAREEKHDPSFMEVYDKNKPLGAGNPDNIDRATDDTKREHAQVHIRINTHQAYVPKEISSLRPDLPAMNVTPFPEDIVIPGITVRDVRFVLLVDKLFRDHFLRAIPSDSELDSNESNLQPEQHPDTENASKRKTGLNSLVRLPETLSSSVPPNGHLRLQIYNKVIFAANLDTSNLVPAKVLEIRIIANLIASIFQRRFCPCCGLAHRLSECRVRHEFPPADGQVCKVCGKTGHWSVDCVEGEGVKKEGSKWSGLKWSGMKSWKAKRKGGKSWKTAPKMVLRV